RRARGPVPGRGRAGAPPPRLRRPPPHALPPREGAAVAGRGRPRRPRDSGPLERRPPLLRRRPPRPPLPQRRRRAHPGIRLRPVPPEPGGDGGRAGPLPRAPPRHEPHLRRPLLVLLRVPRWLPRRQAHPLPGLPREPPRLA